MQQRPADTAARGEAAGDELSVDEVASRLGLPAAMLVRRIEEGSVPARRVEGPSGPEYRLRASALGLDAGPRITIEQPGGDGIGPAMELAGRAVEGELADPGLGRERHRLAELSALGVGPGELVAALLERWERSVEQRIQAEYRLRYEAALADRHTALNRLQGELATARAELALAVTERARAGEAEARDPERDRQIEALRAKLEDDQSRLLGAERELGELRLRAQMDETLLADRERQIADRERVLAARERVIQEQRRDAGGREEELVVLRRRVAEQQEQVETLQAIRTPRRGLFFRR